jgi:hypothetical protein
MFTTATYDPQYLKAELEARHPRRFRTRAGSSLEVERRVHARTNREVVPAHHTR